MHPMDRLQAACQELRSYVCAGLDPHLAMIPEQVTGRDEVDRCRRFLFEVIEGLEGVVPVVKPQIAFFEQLGADGVALYFDVIRECHRRGLLVIGDIKRSDIGSTAAAYARAHLGPSDGSAADFVTLNPYLGIDGIKPFLEVGRAHGRGVFVLARTSNPSSAEFQARLIDGVPLYLVVGRMLEQWGADCVGESGFTDVGAVVGATHPDEGVELRAALPATFFLVPGYGAQGATADDVSGTFTGAGSGAVVNASRSLLFAGRQRTDLSYPQAAREESQRMAAELWAAVQDRG